MDFEDIVIGSGLAALGTTLGLDRSRSVLVVAGPENGHYVHYDARGTVPCSFLGQGGLGNGWHGVIPTGWQRNFGGASDAEFLKMFRRFYPRADVASRMGKPSLFVPWRAIRPRQEFAALLRERSDRLHWLPQLAESFRDTGTGVEVRAGQQTHRARRLWLAAGTLHTPELVDRSLGRRISRDTVSDHIICYIGLAGAQQRPRVATGLDGMFFPATYAADAQALYTLRPAHFSFKKLDHAIEARSVFGMPTGSAISKLARRASPALLAEAFYNRFGLFSRSSAYTVMAQTPVADAYVRTGHPERPLEARPDAFHAVTRAARERQPYADVQLSRRPEIHLPGIHLHHSLDREALHEVGIDQADSDVRVVDASTLRDIGPDHHSFKMMLAAARRAAEAVDAG